jgi:beta-glucosidase
MVVKKVALKAGKAYSVKLEFTECVDFSRMTLGIQRVDQIIDPVAQKMIADADVVVACVGFDATNEGEGYNRTFQLPLDQDVLIQTALAANKNVIVVITSGGGTDMSQWVDQVPVLLQAWYPGQEGGKALAQILFGDVNPSGKLPASFERRWEDSAAYGNYSPDAQNHIAYKEGVFMGYRHFDKAKVKPLFPFGYGLSYTSFKYGNLKVSPDSTTGDNPIMVSFDLTNTGDREGAEVAEVYVGDGHSSVPRPVKELKGFSKVSLKPGETKKVSIALNKRAFSYYDVDSKGWKAEPGAFDILVASSSDKVELKGQVTLK